MFTNMNAQEQYITGSEVLDKHYDKSTQHATIQALLTTLLESYPEQLDKNDFQRLMKNILPWYDDQNIDNLFDMIDAEKCNSTHRIPKHFCTHELTNIVMVCTLQIGCDVLPTPFQSYRGMCSP